MINYLETGTRPDIGYATHQCAKFIEDPRAPHAKAVEHVVKYLQRTCDKGIILKPDTTKSLEVFAVADFSGTGTKKQLSMTLVQPSHERDSLLCTPVVQ